MDNIKKIIWKKHELKYEQYKNSANTIIFIHGFNSSKDFVNPFLELNTNFNIYIVDLPGSKYNLTDKNISIEIYCKLIKKMLSKLRLRKVVLIGHSMGGAIAAYVSRSWRVKKVIYLSPLHPYIYKNPKYNFMKKYYYPRTSKSPKTQFMINKIVDNMSFVKPIKKIKAFLSTNSPWAKIVVNNLLNENYLKKLDIHMKKTLKKATFLIGNNDTIIGTDSIIEWLNLINKEYTLMGKGHNFLNKNPEQIIKYIKL